MIFYHITFHKYWQLIMRITFAKNLFSRRQGYSDAADGRFPTAFLEILNDLAFFHKRLNIVMGVEQDGDRRLKSVGNGNPPLDIGSSLQKPLFATDVFPVPWQSQAGAAEWSIPPGHRGAYESSSPPDQDW
jgi:hypothetical protein